MRGWAAFPNQPYTLQAELRIKRRMLHVLGLGIVMKSLIGLSRILQDAGVNFFAMLPCEKVASLYSSISRDFRHVYLSREEEGVGICGGAYLAGAKPAMLIQSTGLGNMANALCSLTQTYRMPLLILASWRGIYQERIAAQIPLGRSLPGMLDALSIGHTTIRRPNDLSSLGSIADEVYRHEVIHVVLLSPELTAKERSSASKSEAIESQDEEDVRDHVRSKPFSTRFGVLKAASPYLEGKIVVCNLGVPSKELFMIRHQRSNFYMLGSMGLASSIGLGISLFTSKQVVAVDGDGSLLMNLGSLSTIALERPPNLTILAIDNGVHGSTG
ncbi:MAG TPA: sulfopyruvate decarboxylase subunit alpha, partial [Candidatus Bathyarchaeia archaeon]|nr:sulfopyruvate decarboxylase subunit alpha [Candidatus Bathyarchaeia archaeon]